MSFMALGMLLCLVSAVVISAKKSKFKIRCSLVFGAVTITVLVYLQSTANGARIVQSGIVTEAERVNHVVQPEERELFNQHGTLRQQNEESSRLNVNKEEEIVGVSEILEEPTLGSMRKTIKNIERNSLVDKENLLNEEIGKTKDPEEHTSVTILPQSPTRKVDDVMMNAPIRHQRSDVIRMFDDAMTDQEMREYIMDKQEGKHFTRHLTPKSADYKFGK
uniref:Uncharacterized protein n=3 Tax=Ciona intestinalis TaxID=7719 RepID=H2XMZ6_CIOIN